VLNSFFEEIYRLFEDQAKQKAVNFILQKGDLTNCNFDADLIKQSLMNILQNAFDAVNKDGEVILQYQKIKTDLVIQVDDNGIGISSDNQKNIFDLYYTSKKDGNGLGLSISQKIIAQHNGSISVSSMINKGTTFKIILPI
jgi:two-component system sensor histidine kinase AtoS